MCSSLTDQVQSIAEVMTAVAKGDLTQKIEIQVEGEGILGDQAHVEGVTKAVALGDLRNLVNVDIQGEMLDLKMTMNLMVA